MMNEFVTIYWGTVITLGALFSVYLVSDMVSYIVAVVKRAKEVGKPEKIVVSAKDFNFIVEKLGKTDDTD
jgi:hypothetical protein